MAIVSIKSQQVTFYDAEGWILRAPVSTGVTGRETPAGVFAVLEKDKDHHSSLYDDAWMPNMQRITWNGIALHGGPLPGYAASHGCVRMPYGFAEKLFDKTRIGMRVIISPNDAAPVEFSHPALFVPNAEAVAAAPARAETLAREAGEAAKTADEAKKAAATAAREAASLPASLRKLERLKARADAELAFADKAIAAAKTDEARAKAEDAKAEGRRQGRGTGDAARHRQGRREVEARRRRCRKGRRQGGRDQEGRHRQGGERGEARARAGLDLHQPRDAEALRAAQHAQAVRRTAARCSMRPLRFRSRSAIPTSGSARTCSRRWRASDAGLRWTAVTIDDGDDAKDALDRITIPQEVLDRIAPTALPRSSIIVSDEPLSRETNYRTEFVAVLNNQPQGGFMTRKPTPSVDVRLASRGDLVLVRNARGEVYYVQRDDGFGSFFQPGWGVQSQPQPQPIDPRRGGRQYYRQVQPVQQGWGW